jgi:hypothetical protein
MTFVLPNEIEGISSFEKKIDNFFLLAVSTRYYHITVKGVIVFAGRVRDVNLIDTF